VVPAAVVLRAVISPSYEFAFAPPAFSISKLMSTDIWYLIFGNSVDLPFQKMILQELPAILGIVGLGYALTHRGKYNRNLCIFLLASFILCLIDYRILDYAMVNVPFGPGRVRLFMDFSILPFIGVTASSFVRQFGKRTPKIDGSSLLKRILKVRFVFGMHGLAICLVCVSLSSLAVAVIYENYAARRGLQVTRFEMDVVEFIDSHTPERYAVITDPRLWSVGNGLVGYYNPQKLYIYFRGDKSNEIYSDPSIENMNYAMAIYGASVGYYMAVSFRTPNYQAAIEKASTMFLPYATFQGRDDTEIRVFRYERPVPVDSDVTTLYWALPPTYIIQNDLMRVLIDVTNEKLEVRDHWGILYERLDLNETLMGNEELGNIMSVKYYHPDNNRWVVWDPEETVPSIFAFAQQFRFKVCFKNVSLVGTVERGKPFVQLWWEGEKNCTLKLSSGGFDRLYIPGIIGSVDSYDVISHEYGLLYTASRTDGALIHPALRREISSVSLSLSEIERYCRYTLTEKQLSYDFYIENSDEIGQWTYTEVCLPDKVYLGVFPPISYSLDDGKTWFDVASSREPVKTVDGKDVRWVVTVPGMAGTKPKAWTYSTSGEGESFKLPENFTDSGGAQNRLLFGLYLPSKDQALVRLGVSVYKNLPLKTTYVFRDAEHAGYGLRNMNDTFVGFYNWGSIEYVGGVAVSKKIQSLQIVQDETRRLGSMVFTIPSNTTFSLLSVKGADTTVDEDGNGVPDVVSGESQDSLRQRAYQSLVKLSYEIQQLNDRNILKAKISYSNDWGIPVMVTICVPSKDEHEEGTFIYERGLCKVLEVAFIGNETEAITLYKET